jgi:hypothetical protein
MNNKSENLESFILKNIVHPLFKPVVIYATFAAIFIANIIIYLLSENFYLAYFYGEDKITEWVTFFGFFCGSLLGFAILLFQREQMNRWTVVYLFGLSFFLFVCAGEEISWGQRIFGFATPEGFVELNQQQEFNIHNLKVEFIHPRDIIGIFNYLWGIVLPVGFFYKAKNSTWRRYIFSPVAAVCFLWAEFLNFIAKPLVTYLGPGMEKVTVELIINQSDEMVEMFWGLSAFVGMLSIYAAWSNFSSQQKMTAAQAVSSPL